jgi:dihydrodipicolinate synthase/N-acetylneuraminate lyase
MHHFRRVITIGFLAVVLAACGRSEQPVGQRAMNAYKAGDYNRAEEIQRRLNRCFPRGGEETLGHLGTTKVTASVATGIEMGPARPPYMAPADAADRIRKRLPALDEVI